jgi:hypothetical protein
MMNAGKKKTLTPTTANAVRAIDRARALELDVVMKRKSRVPTLDEVTF